MSIPLNELVVAVLGWAFGGVFTAGCFYIYVRMSISNLERWGQENHDRLDKKIDKNFETLDVRISALQDRLLEDIKGIGAKVGFNERHAHRRYHNLSAAMMMAAPSDKEAEVGALLKEEAS